MRKLKSPPRPPSKRRRRTKRVKKSKYIARFVQSKQHRVAKGIVCRTRKSGKTYYFKVTSVRKEGKKNPTPVYTYIGTTLPKYISAIGLMELGLL